VRGGIPLSPRALDLLVERHGGEIRNGGRGLIRRIAPIGRASAGDLAPLFNARYLPEAREALARGATILIDDTLDVPETKTLAGWFHPFATWALAELLDLADTLADEPYIGNDVKIGTGAILLPRSHIGNRVTIAPGAVIGAPGFGFASGPNGKVREIPQLGGVVVEDDVHIGANCTIASGTIAPTYIRRGVKLDAQVHIGHNCDVGEGTVIAAQSGLAGSVVVGKNVMMGGQVGIADHVTIGDGVKIAAKSGVIGDVAAGETVAGYPAVQRTRWLRGLAAMYRFSERNDS
jgi:UDP-3-O-[3-hydroxymyristoyl] glucosamine N-acyltransferase